MLNRYQESTCRDTLLGGGHSIICTQPEYFWSHTVYYCDPDAMILYIEHGWGKGAHQILLKFNDDRYRYDSYELPPEPMDFPNRDDFPDDKKYQNAIKKYDTYWKRWDDKHTRAVYGDIFAMLRAFDKQEMKLEKDPWFKKIQRSKYMKLSDIDKEVGYFLKAINESSNLSVNRYTEDIPSFIKAKEGRISVMMIGVDPKNNTYKPDLFIIDKDYDGKEDKYVFNCTLYGIKRVVTNKGELKSFIQEVSERLDESSLFYKYADTLFDLC